MVFWQYAKRCVNGEYWITPEKYEHMMTYMRTYHRARYALNPGLYCPTVPDNGSRFSVLRPLEERRARKRIKRNLSYQITHVGLVRAKRLAVGMVSRMVRDILRGARPLCHQKVGCSQEVFVAFLMDQMRDGMIWSSARNWQIDHFIPVSSARSEAELRELNHYTNLRPVWGSENMEKHDSIPSAAEQAFRDEWVRAWHERNVHLFV